MQKNDFSVARVIMLYTWPWIKDILKKNQMSMAVKWIERDYNSILSGYNLFYLTSYVKSYD